MAHKSRLAANESKCSGCLRCALACSFFTSTERLFNLSQSKISILPRFDQGGFEVILDENCNGCGICIAYCGYDALQLEEVQA